jgi:hypothetical protein
MEYAIQLLLPILGGLYLGLWLHNRYGFSKLWIAGLAILGMVLGLGMMYKRLKYGDSYEPPKKTPKEPKNHTDETQK